MSSNKQKVRKAVITDAGYATRFLPVTKTLPKSMIPIMDKPITHYVVEECMAAGITEIIVVATEEGKPIYEDYFHNTVQHIYEQLEKQDKQERFDKVREVFSLPGISVITQNRDLPYGNGNPALSAKPYIGDEPFIYVYADDIILGESSCKELVEEYQNSDDDVAGIIAAKDLPNLDVTKYGMVKLKEGTDNVLDYIVEKPDAGTEPSKLASFGRYLVTPKIFDYLAPTKDNLGKDNELWMTDAIARMAHDHKVLVKPISGTWLTAGDPMNYLKATIEFVLDSKEYNGDFENFLREKVSGFNS